MKFLSSPALLSSLFCTFLLGCGTLQGYQGGDTSGDPLEPVNRKIFQFNEGLDKNVVEPLATEYRDSVPNPIKKSLRNFTTNLKEPKTAVNSLLQGDLKNFGNATTRFLANIAFGYGGFVDVASKEKVFSTKKDFGQTLGVWGVSAGPYLVLPLLGPSDARDATGKIADSFLDPVGQLLSIDNLSALDYTQQGVYLIDKRALLLDTVDNLRDNSVDFYARVRSLYRQEQESALGTKNFIAQQEKRDKDFEQFFEEDTP